MKHLPLKALALMSTLLMAALGTQHASARPNWPDYADHEHVYTFEDWSPHTQCTFRSTDDKTYISLTLGKDGIYTVDHESGEYFHLPAGVTAGDRVYRTDMCFVFVNKQGKAYYSLNVVDSSRSRNEKAKELMFQILMLVDGNYGNKQGKEVTIDATYQVLTIGGGVEEPITEAKEYTSGGVTYMEIRTGKRHWYLRPTAEGLDVYQAAKPKVAKGKKVQASGKSLARIMSLRYGTSVRFVQSTGRFQMLSYGIMPLMQLVRKYYPKELIKVLSDELAKQKKDTIMQKLAPAI